MLCRTLRILVDESVAHPFEAELTALDVATVRDPGWSGLRNGVLLRAAVDAGFDVLITRDRSLPYQHNLRRIGISVLVLTGVRNRVEELRMLVPQILSILPLLRPGDASKSRRSQAMRFVIVKRLFVTAPRREPPESGDRAADRRASGRRSSADH